MKDKELRQILSNKGIIVNVDGSLRAYDYPPVTDLRLKVRELDEELYRALHNNKTLFNLFYVTRDRVVALEAKFDAINKHYGITVEHEDAKYTVKEIK